MREDGGGRIGDRMEQIASRLSDVDGDDADGEARAAALFDFRGATVGAGAIQLNFYEGGRRRRAAERG